MTLFRTSNMPYLKHNGHDNDNDNDKNIKSNLSSSSSSNVTVGHIVVPAAFAQLSPPDYLQYKQPG